MQISGLHILLTYRCTLECDHCFVWGGPRQSGVLAIEDIIRILSQAQEAGVRSIYFEGGEITRLPSHRIAELGIARSFQGLQLFNGLSVLDNIVAGRHFLFKTSILSDALYFGRTRREEIKHRKVVEKIIDFLEIEPVRKQIVGSLPYGMRKRVDLGRALVAEPKLLLLDESMAGMNRDEKEDMARFILDISEEMGITIAVVEHDMGLVMDICEEVVVLEFGRKIAEGAPEEIRSNEKVIRAYLGKAQ